MLKNINEKVLVQGDSHHSFHAQAAGLLGITLDMRETAQTHDELYARLRAREYHQAVVATVNSSTGRIRGSYDHILRGDLAVINKVDLPIIHHLYAPEGAQLEDILYIHTQEPAYLQCSTTLQKYFPNAEWIPETDTALSAQIVSGLNDLEHAAITPKSAGDSAGLVCLKEDIQDMRNNTTTFLLVSHSPQPVDSANTSTVFAKISLKKPHTYQELQKRLNTLGVRASLLHPSDMLESIFIAEIVLAGHSFEWRMIKDALGDLCEIKSLSY
ncbi:MAG TPA: prephenate dehydratase domain-containing protein [Patescibacteria group bacterium]|jgi:prephenate dehydratase|nr:prephenate dehydratase domain-containing protein [Patescibacteria group bacterium]